MKKLVLLLSFVFMLGLVSVEANNNKKVVNKVPAKTEQTTKTTKSHKTGKKVMKGKKAASKAKPAPKTSKK